jgi:nucleoside-diphosphate-sugar epimerase
MQGQTDLCEDSPLNPVSFYARSKIKSEESILSLVDENFSPVILRMGTLYGYSPRMRFDLVVNTMVKTAVTEDKIYIHGGGKQWRPLLYVEDAAQAYLRCLEAPIEPIKGEVFNVGSKAQNCQIAQIARVVKQCIPAASLVMDGKVSDARNYFVSFEKIKRLLKFKTSGSLSKAIYRIKKAITTREFSDVNDTRYYNVDYNK